MYASRVIMTAALHLLYDGDLEVQVHTKEHAAFMAEWGVGKAQRAARTSDIDDAIVKVDMMHDRPHFWLGEFSHSAPSVGIFGGEDTHPSVIQMALFPHIYSPVTDVADSPTLPQILSGSRVAMTTLIQRLMASTTFSYTAVMEFASGRMSTFANDVELILHGYYQVFAYFIRQARTNPGEVEEPAPAELSLDYKEMMGLFGRRSVPSPTVMYDPTDPIWPEALHIWWNEHG
jgi:hypothetical protein